MRNYLLSLLIITIINCSTCVPLWGQCGGSEYTGSTLCDLDLTCYKKDEWYSQCLNSCPIGWACQNGFLATTDSSQIVPTIANLYDQCGGIGFTGPKTCAKFTFCFKKHEWYSQCLYTCPTGWACDNSSNQTFSVTAKLYEQCGGLDFTGPTTCENNIYCMKKNEWYSQCLYTCPTGWACDNSSTSSNQTFSVTAKLYEQCGGLDFKGPTTCENNTFCFKQHDWYSQCLYTCPIGWACPPTRSCIGTKSLILSKNKDWRSLNAVSPVKDQRDCNSCWAFAATSAIESQYLIIYQENILLSEQYLVDCSGFGDCSAGFPDIAFNYVIKNGIPLSASYPYIASKGACKMDPRKNAANITEFEYILNDEFKMQQAVDAIGPIVVFFNRNILDSYSGGIINDPNCLRETDHVGLAVGYGTENGTDYWIVKNSWGTSGYFKIARGKNMCGIGIKAMFPIVYKMPELCQCNGFEYIGANLCEANLACYKDDEYHSQCLSSCPSGWACNSNSSINSTQSFGTVPLYSQCGGLNYKGPTVCSEGSCYYQQVWYSQCLLACPVGWLCQSNFAQFELKVWKSTEELFFQKLNTTTWAQINYTKTLNYLSFYSLANDTIILIETKTNTYYKLNSVDLRTGSSLANLNTFVTSGSWLLFYKQSSGSYGIWKQKNANNYFISLSPTNANTWIHFDNGFNTLINFIRSTKCSHQAILYDSKNDKYLKVSSLNIMSGKSFKKINTFEFAGTWTSFAPGFTLYGPSITSNTTKLG